MRAAQTVYLTLDRSRAVLEGDKAAQFLLVRAGQEIPQAQAERYAGAIELIGGTKKAEPEQEMIQHRDPEPANRDPKAKPPHK